MNGISGLLVRGCAAGFVFGAFLLNVSPCPGQLRGRPANVVSLPSPQGSTGSPFGPALALPTWYNAAGPFAYPYAQPLPTSYGYPFAPPYVNPFPGPYAPFANPWQPYPPPLPGVYPALPSPAGMANPW